MTVYYAPIARLLGDLVVSLPPLQALIKEGKEVCLVLRSKAQYGLAERIPGLHSIILEEEFLRLNQENQCEIINLRDHPLQRDFVWGSPEFEEKYPGLKIDDMIRKICADFGISDGQSSLRPLQFVRKKEAEGKIVLIPGTAGPIKRWKTDNWISLYEELGALKKEVLMVGEPHFDSQLKELFKLGIPWIATPLLSDALDIVSSADAVIAVDTGLMHLAAHQGTPTIGMMRQNSFFARKIPNAKYLIANACSRECTAKEFAFTPNGSVFYKEDDAKKIYDYWTNLHCQVENRCMNSISVEDVVYNLNSMTASSTRLSARPRVGRSFE